MAPPIVGRALRIRRGQLAPTSSVQDVKEQARAGPARVVPDEGVEPSLAASETAVPPRESGMICETYESRTRSDWVRARYATTTSKSRGSHESRTRTVGFKRTTLYSRANDPYPFYASYVSSSCLSPGWPTRTARRSQWVTATCDSLSLYTLETKKPAILFGERARSTTTRPLDYTHLRLIDRANGGIVAFARIAPEVRSEG